MNRKVKRAPEREREVTIRASSDDEMKSNEDKN